MKRSVATALGVLMAVLGVSSIGSAQPVIHVHGVLQGVDCRANSVALKMPDGVHVLPATRYTAAFVDSRPVSLCTLAQYVGRDATVSLTASESQFVAGRIDIFTVARPAPPAPSGQYYAPSYPYAPYYATPYCYAPYPGPYYGPPPFCYGPYAGYYYPYPAYYYGPPFIFGIGVVLHPGPFYRHHR
jgi:hypothetical protein